MNSNIDAVFNQALTYAYQHVDKNKYSQEIFYAVVVGRFSELLIDEISKIVPPESELLIRNHFDVR